VRFTTGETSAQDILNAEFPLLNSTVSAALQEYREGKRVVSDGERVMPAPDQVLEIVDTRDGPSRTEADRRQFLS